MAELLNFNVNLTFLVLYTDVLYTHRLNASQVRIHKCQIYLPVGNHYFASAKSYEKSFHMSEMQFAWRKCDYEGECECECEFASLRIRISPVKLQAQCTVVYSF